LNTRGFTMWKSTNRIIMMNLEVRLMAKVIMILIKVIKIQRDQ